MSIETLITKLNTEANSVQFAEVIAAIDENYNFTPTEFKNGELNNEAGQNSGSCKIFSFAQLHNLSEEQTLACFGDYYRVDVVQHPEATDHQNIRNFIKYGWAGINFKGSALSPK